MSKAKATSTKSAATSGKGRPSFKADDPRLKSKRWTKCACGVNLMHIGSKQCWACSGKADPKTIMGDANPYAAYLLALQSKNKRLKAKVAAKTTEMKAVKKAARAVRVTTLAPVSA